MCGPHTCRTGSIIRTYRPGALLEQNLPRFADRVAVQELHHETGSVGRVLTYAQLWRAVRSAARGLQKYGVAPGVHVGFCLPNSSALIVGYYATWCAGGTVVPANPAARDSEVTEQFTDARWGSSWERQAVPGRRRQCAWGCRSSRWRRCRPWRPLCR